MERGIILLLALGIDRLLGDPPNRFHPVAWMGLGIAAAQKRRPWDNLRAELAYGAGIVVGGGLLVGALAALAQRLAAGLPKPFGGLAEAALLKTVFSLRGLDRAAGEVQTALEAGNLPLARQKLAWHLVSRDVSSLDEGLVAAATIESVAENASDGVVAPLAAYALGGLPLAYAYRFVNTCDSMLGYHTPELEWLGKVPARLDDALNRLPARLTGRLLALAAPLAHAGRAAPLAHAGRTEALHAMQRDARLTESPNAGYPMSAMAGALGVELEKQGHYRLNAGGRRPTAADIGRARRLLRAACGLAALLLAGAITLRGKR